MTTDRYRRAFDRRVLDLGAAARGGDTSALVRAALLVAAAAMRAHGSDGKAPREVEAIASIAAGWTSGRLGVRTAERRPGARTARRAR